MENIEIVNPSDPKRELIYKAKYNLCGIKNTRTILKSYPNVKKTVHRFGLFLPSKDQIIIEIWNSSTNMEPRFEPDWVESLQMCLIKQCSYHGTITIDEKEVYVFRLSQKEPEKRFIWLSPKNFWDCPVDIPNNEPVFDVTYFPDIYFKDGDLKISPGSVITPYWTRFGSSWKLTTTTDYGSWTFCDYQKAAETINKTIRNVKTGRDRLQQRDRSILFHR